MFMVLFSQYLRDVSMPCPVFNKEKGLHITRTDVFKLFPVSAIKIPQKNCSSFPAQDVYLVFTSLQSNFEVKTCNSAVHISWIWLGFVLIVVSRVDYM